MSLHFEDGTVADGGQNERDAWIDNLRAQVAALQEDKRCIYEAYAEVPTLRDRFAMAALTGLYAAGASWVGPSNAYEIADAMIQARKGKPENGNPENGN